MMRDVHVLFTAFVICIFCSGAQSQQPAVTDLRTEYMVNPLGIDETHPRFTWRMHDTRPGARQTAFRIQVDTDSILVVRSGGRVWDSGCISSDDMRASFNGAALQPFTRYFWKVEITDYTGTTLTAREVAAFETGMIDSRNWQGAWISDANSVAVKPAPYFRKTFTLSGDVRSARTYIAVAGLYELYINGIKIGNHRLDPMYTRFDRRTLYVTHDVTPYLKKGDNTIGVLLGNGWYNHQSTAVWNFHTAPWRNRPAFCLDLRIVQADGSVTTVTSDKDWKTSLSPVIFNSIYTGEHYDARLEQRGWSTADFDDKKWKEVVYRAAPSQHIVAQVMHPVRDVEVIPARNMTRLNDTTCVFDLGRNISGVSRIKVKGKRGSVLRLKHGERLLPNGHVDLSNIDAHYRPTDQSDPFQTDIFILSGDGEESFTPRFNYKGFQYVEVTGNVVSSLSRESLTGYFMHSDVPVSGKIVSSNTLLNNLWQATNNSYLSNLFGYPTDCPQREKNGWTGDAHIAVETGLFNFDGITVYEKWMRDHQDEQQPNGTLPSIIPTGGWGYEWGNGPDWTSTIAIIPWNIYVFYGDAKILADCYDNIKRYVDLIDARYPSGLTSWGLGDWVPVKSKAPVPLTSTCYYFADVRILSRAAAILGKTDDQQKYAALAEKIKTAFNQKYFNREKALYGGGTQTELSAPLYWGLVPEADKSRVAAQLASRVKADNFHVDVGILGHKAILNALGENGYADVAYKIALQDTYPSWGWWIKNGATTLYENWRVDAKSDISMNHIMFGEIGAWMYKTLAGIRCDASAPGFKHFTVQPYIPADLRTFEGTYKSVRGTIVSSWAATGDTLHYTVVVPANTTATLIIPAVGSRKPYRESELLRESQVELQPGTHKFVFK